MGSSPWELEFQAPDFGWPSATWFKFLNGGFASLSSEVDGESGAFGASEVQGVESLVLYDEVGRLGLTVYAVGGWFDGGWGGGYL